MKLVASLIVRNERARYLDACIDHLLDFCDEVAIVDDASTDHTIRHLQARLDPRLKVKRAERSFLKHEGRARQELLDWTLAREPTHVLSIDADEFVSDGAELRRVLENEPDVPVWTLAIEEVWNANELGLGIREDGGWRTHPLACCWKAPARPDVSWRIKDKQLACQRVPVAVLTAGRAARPSGVSLLHWGWTDKTTRQARYDRYAKHDGGRFHASAHLRSILYPDARVTLRPRSWPKGDVFADLRDSFAGVNA